MMESRRVTEADTKARGKTNTAGQTEREHPRLSVYIQSTMELGVMRRTD